VYYYHNIMSITLGSLADTSCLNCKPLQYVQSLRDMML
jgi:hypothetical protein